MIRLNNGKISLENIVIDLEEFEVRRKVQEADLERDYDSFISHVPEIRECFEYEDAFDEVVREAANEKRPKLIPRDIRAPFILNFKKNLNIFNSFDPHKKKLDDDYFIVAHCMIQISSNRKSEGKMIINEEFRKDIADKFAKYPGYEGIIEIPNDRTPAEVKSSVFHEALHYIIFRYQAKTCRRFVDAQGDDNLSDADKYRIENIVHERVVEILTDKLLSHDPDAQFSERWDHYSLENGFKMAAHLVSAIATGVAIVNSIKFPYLIPLVFVPGRARDYAIQRYKKSKREEMLRPVEYPEFKVKI